MAERDTPRTVFRRGESYVTRVTRSRGAFEKKYPLSYEQTVQVLTDHLLGVKDHIRRLPKGLALDEYVMCLRLYSEFLAKSYHPSSLLRHDSLTEIGSRRWIPTNETTSSDSDIAKMIFVRTSDQKIDQLIKYLHSDSAKESRQFSEAVRRLKEISILSPEEKLLSFHDKWNEGRVEIVLHPFGHRQDEVLKLLRQAIGYDCHEDCQRVQVRTRNGWPVFVSARVTRDSLNKLGHFNPLRAVRPIGVSNVPNLRVATGPKAPLPPSSHQVSGVTVGVFDGGLDETNPLIKDFVKLGAQSVKTPLRPEFVAHGTGVSGVILYGDLNQYSSKSNLPTPPVTVEMFRVFPTVDPLDPDCFEVVDIIETTVVNNRHIRVFNLSLGPFEPVLDDDVSYFTSTLDKLAYEHGVLFTVAVGNTGDTPTPTNRIQPPSDLVNGLGIGSHTYDQTERICRAPYSSVGAGREGCKVKPDVVAFGGSHDRPISLVGPHHGFQVTSTGTSFAAPAVARLSAEAIARANLSPIAARALIVHTAQHPNPKLVPDYELGYGALIGSVDKALTASRTKVTTVYEASISPTAMAKLPILIPRIGCGYMATITWTIVALSSIDPLNANEYTETCLEETFHPNAYRYRFTNRSTRKTESIDTEDSPGKYDARMASEDWVRSSGPISDSTRHGREQDRRRGTKKWDTAINQRVRKQTGSLKKPYLIVHCMCRNQAEEDQAVPYVALITVDVPNYPGDLHREVQEEFHLLQPIVLRTKSELLVEV